MWHLSRESSGENKAPRPHPWGLSVVAGLQLIGFLIGCGIIFIERNLTAAHVTQAGGESAYYYAMIIAVIALAACPGLMLIMAFVSSADFVIHSSSFYFPWP